VQLPILSAHFGYLVHSSANYLHCVVYKGITRPRRLSNTVVPPVPLNHANLTQRGELTPHGFARHAKFSHYVPHSTGPALMFTYQHHGCNQHTVHVYYLHRLAVRAEPSSMNGV